MTAPVARHPTRRHRWCALPAVVLLAGLLLGCTDDPPDELTPPDPPPAEESAGPPTGRDVALVLPDTSVLEPVVREALSARLAAVADDLPTEVGRLHVLQPDAPAFVGDLLELAAARDAQLACVLGPDTQSLADAVARRHGRTAVCALPAAVPPDDDGEPPPAVRVEVPSYELGLLVGTAARVAAEARAATAVEDDDEDVDAPDPVVGLVLGGDELDGERFLAGVVAGLEEVAAIEVAEPTDDPTAAVAAVLAAGAEVIVLDGGEGAAEALAAIPAGIGVVGPSDLAPRSASDDGPRWVLAYRLAWERVLADLIEHLVAGSLESLRVEASFGVLVLQPDPAVPGLEAALEQVLDAVEDRGDDPPATAPPGGTAGDDADEGDLGS